MYRKAGMGGTGLFDGDTTASWKLSVFIICSQIEVGFLHTAELESRVII